MSFIYTRQLHPRQRHDSIQGSGVIVSRAVALEYPGRWCYSIPGRDVVWNILVKDMIVSKAETL